MLWLMGEHLCHAWTTCHHLLPEQPSQSECEVGGLQGLPAPSGRLDCCYNCQGNQERQYDRLWHFLSSLHRTLSEKKQQRKREDKELEGKTRCGVMKLWKGVLKGAFLSVHRLHQSPVDCSLTIQGGSPGSQSA